MERLSALGYFVCLIACGNPKERFIALPRFPLVVHLTLTSTLLDYPHFSDIDTGIDHLRRTKRDCSRDCSVLRSLLPTAQDVPFTAPTNKPSLFGERGRSLGRGGDPLLGQQREVLS